MKRTMIILFHFPKDKMWLSHFSNNFKIRVLYPFSSKVIRLNKVSVFIGYLSNWKHDIINSHDRRFNDTK